MARITSQAAVEAVGNRYDLVLIASQRVRELKRGAKPKVFSTNNTMITALREIEQGHIGKDYLKRIR